MSRRDPRLYWRQQGGARRAYADLRAYADVGGGQEALIAPREKRATTDAAIAQSLLAKRIQELEARRRGRELLGVEAPATLQEFARLHLIAKAKSGKVTEAWLKLAEHHLACAVEYFGAGRELVSITVPDVRRWAEHLQQGLAGGTVRHYLNVLSGLYTRARAEQAVSSGFNPVGDMPDKPTAAKREAKWLEIHDAALLLEAARTYRPPKSVGGPPPFPFGYELVATFLLTGGRASEVLGLELADVSLDRGLVTFRPNAWRRLKNDGSLRSVPLWPQLREILERYLVEHPPSRLLFPSYRTKQEAMATDFHKQLDAIAARGGWKAGEIRSKMFRHTYCAARLQTLDQGAPVSVYTVARELGHGGESMVRRVYGHLGQVRHRADVVEYRAEQFVDKLGDRLAALGARD